MNDCVRLLIHTFAIIHWPIAMFLFCHPQHQSRSSSWLWSRMWLWSLSWRMTCTLFFGGTGSNINRMALLVVRNQTCSLCKLILLHVVHIKTIFRDPNTFSSIIMESLVAYVPQIAPKMVLKPSHLMVWNDRKSSLFFMLYSQWRVWFGLWSKVESHQWYQEGLWTNWYAFLSGTAEP